MENLNSQIEAELQIVNKSKTIVLRPDAKSTAPDSIKVLRRRDFTNAKSGTIEIPEKLRDYSYSLEDESRILKIVELLRAEDIKRFEQFAAGVKADIEEMKLKLKKSENTIPKRNVDGIQAKSNDDVIAEVTERSLPIRPMSNVPPLESTVTLPPDTQSTAVTSDTIIGDTTQVGSKVPFIRRMSVGLDDLTKLQ